MDGAPQAPGAQAPDPAEATVPDQLLGALDRASGAADPPPPRLPAPAAAPAGVPAGVPPGVPAGVPTVLPAPPAAVVDEPPQPHRIRRPSDLIRFAAWGLGVGLLLLLGDVAIGTASGLEQDLTTAVTTLPDLLLPVVATGASLLLLALPVVLVLDLVLRWRWRTLLDSAIAAAVAWAAAAAFQEFAVPRLTPTLLDALTRMSGGTQTPAAFPLLSSVVAFVSIEGLRGRPRLTLFTWATGVGFGLLLMVDGVATPLALLLSAVSGRAIGVGLRYVFGTVNRRPSGAEVAAALTRVAMPMAALRLVDDETGDGRRYDATAHDGRRVVLEVYDRDRRAAGLLYSAYRALRVRNPVERREALSLRRAVEQAALPSYAATVSGARTPRLLAASAVGPDATVLAYEHVDGLRRFADLDPHEVTDEMVTDAWRQARGLHRCGIAHETLNDTNLAVDRRGQVWLLGLDEGEIAAEQLTLRIDDAELLVTTALLVGAQRAVDAALRELTRQRLGEALPLLQPIALSRRTRGLLKQHRGLLTELRDAVVEASPTAPTEAVRLERVRPRVVVAFLALGFAVYLLLGQLGNVDLNSLITSASPWWFAAALAASLVTYGAAAMTITGFSPVRLSAWRTVLAQFAATFVTLVAPPAVGGVATNSRFLQKAGAEPSLAVASVGVSQALGFVTYVVLLLLFGLATGVQADTSIVPSRTVLLALLVIVLVGSLAMVVPASRRVVVQRVRPVFSRTLPRLLQVLRSPRRIALGLGGQLLLTFAYTLALAAAVRAYGGSLPFAATAFVFLAAGAIGSAAPTPGGIGAVEAALAAGLAAVGLDGTTAVQAALLFRTVTFWLPVVPGWFAFTWLQRSDAL